MGVVHPELRQLVRETQETAAARYARWDATLFDWVARRGAWPLSRGLKDSPDHTAVLRSYLDLAREALVCGYITRGVQQEDGSPRVPTNLVELLWLQTLPRQLGAVAPADRLRVLAECWNLAEGLLTQPLWLNAVVTSAVAANPSLPNLRAMVSACLEETLTASKQAGFTGPFSVEILNTPEHEVEFLPGEMHLAAPSVVCVHDRLRTDLCLGVALRPGGTHRILGPMGCLGEAVVEDGAPTGRAVDGRVVFSKAEAPLTGLREPHRAVLSPIGFFVASAVDSQRLWVVESP